MLKISEYLLTIPTIPQEPKQERNTTISLFFKRLHDNSIFSPQRI